MRTPDFLFQCCQRDSSLHQFRTDSPVSIFYLRSISLLYEGFILFIMSLHLFLLIDFGLFRLACLMKKQKCMLDHEDQGIFQLKCLTQSLLLHIFISDSKYSLRVSI